MFLISDPVPATEVDYYEVEIDGNITRSDPQVDTDMVRLHHELIGLSLGNHTARVRGANAWGEGVWSDPFDFAVVLPSVPSGIGLSAD